MIGCQQTGNALVVDANRDVQQYIAAAAKEKLRITHVTETHIHADFVSGSRELAGRSGAQLFLSGEGGADWQYAFANESGAQLLRDGDHFMVGNIRIEVLHTPGHTPEHLSFVVTDTPANSGPWGILTGDFVFVGDVGRPDLLEKAAGHAGTMEGAARTLFHSLKRIREMPDHLQIWPGHGAGSACGKALGAVPSSTLGYEKIGNWALAISDENEFVKEVLDGQPAPPKYFATMKRVNRDGPEPAGNLAEPSRLGSNAVIDILASDAIVVDTRRAVLFGEGHIPGTINIPLNSSFTKWAGWLLPYDRDMYFIVDSACSTCALEVTRELSLIGLDRIAGTFGSDAVEAWRSSGRELETIHQASPQELDRSMQQGDVTVIDVRAPDEWEAGHLPGVRNIPLGELVDHVAELPTDKTIVLHCQGGGRSSIGASLLQAKGLRNVSNLRGGFDEWEREVGKVERKH